jgi:uncharacterized protein involved in propanediol utilization
MGCLKRVTDRAIESKMVNLEGTDGTVDKEVTMQ